MFLTKERLAFENGSCEDRCQKALQANSRARARQEEEELKRHNGKLKFKEDLGPIGDRVQLKKDKEMAGYAERLV